MCTVSYIRLNDKQLVLTSNRDERIARPTLPPVAEVIGCTTVFFPKDQQAGGTWIAAGDNGRICCLLNGAFQPHKRKKNYVKSRGRLLLETFEHLYIHDFFHSCKLNDVEPFTLIVSERDGKSKLTEFRWDGIRKHIRELKHNRHYIWSSATLYGKKTRKQREKWFKHWFNNNKDIEREQVLNFHSATHGNDQENDLIMKRAHGLQTVSITQIEVYPDCFSMYYHDRLKNNSTSLIKELKSTLNA